MSVVSHLNYMKLKYKIFMYSTYYVLTLFITSTILLFLYLNRIQPHYFIDEAFHVLQTIRYCAWNFTQWDPKITTLPELYLITTVILSPFNMCNITYIRCINLFGTCLNLYLIYNIIKEICKSNETERWNNWLILMLAYNISLFLPFLLLMLFLLYRCYICKYSTRNVVSTPM